MFRVPRLLVVYALAVPLALFLGYLVATPDMASLAVVGLVFFLLAVPILIHWSHLFLLLCWNSVLIFGFLPGRPQAWFVFAILAFTLSMINHVMGRKTFLRAPEMIKPLLFLVVVVLVTAKYRGGLGLKILGSGSIGSKHYLNILVAIMGYFALTAYPIPIAKSDRAVKWFLLSGTTSILSNVIALLGPAFYLFYYIVPAGLAEEQLTTASWQNDYVQRFSGIGGGACFVFYFALARWGVRGIMDWTKPWRILLVLLAIFAQMLGGFRSGFVFLLLMLFFLFTFEGLWKTPLFPIISLIGGLCLLPVLVFINKMPTSIQRTLSFLPVQIDPVVRADAAYSEEWRFDMWRAVLPEIPKYLLIGKGYGMNPGDYILANEEVQLGMAQDYEVAMAVGEYHSGPLSVLVPLGIFGAIAFFLVMRAGVKILQSNRRYGDPRLKRLNDFILAYFLAEIVQFVFVFGAFDWQFYTFLGLVGVSIGLNGGVCRRPVVARQTIPSPSLATPLATA